MRVLWFTNSTANYSGRENPYNGGGWISSLEKEMRKREDIKLAVSFILKGHPEKVSESNVTYYPISIQPYSLRNKIFSKVCLHNYNYEKTDWHKFTEPMLRVIEDFKPDIIEIFGSESPFSLIAAKISIPVVLHIQGLLNPYWNAFFPPFISPFSYYFRNLNIFSVYQRHIEIVGFKRSCWREREQLKMVHHYIGRTEWSQRVISVLNPKAQYYYGGEILRDIFYQSVNRTIPDRLTIVSTISQPMYKGFDLLLKTAQLLKEQNNMDFEWKVFGNINPLVAEKQIGIHHDDVNVILNGVADATTLKEVIASATVYAHTAYIENSPNSVCEAQMVGIPVVATNVGGVSSLIEEGVTGYTVPANDPYQMAFLIKKLYSDQQLNLKISSQARAMALKRHNREEITCDLIDIYKKIIG